MSKIYDKDRIAKEINLNPLTSYERWIYEHARKNYKSKPQILELRNNLSEKELVQLNLKQKTISRQALYDQINKIELKLKFKLFSTDKPNLIQKWIKEEPWRVHAKGFTIKIKGSSNKYLQTLQIKNKDTLDNNTLELYRNKIVVWSNKDFFGETNLNALDKSELYWDNFLRELEHKYQLDLFKNGIEIYEFRNHIAHINNPLKINEEIPNNKIKIYDNLGRLRILFDNSFNFDELECVNPQLYKQDSSRLQKELQDWVNYPNSLLPSELTNVYTQLLDNMNKLSHNLNKSVENSLNSSKQIEILVQSQIYQSKQIEILNNNMNNLIKLLTPKEITQNEFKPNLDYFQ